jgi:hypothetical protein
VVLLEEGERHLAVFGDMDFVAVAGELRAENATQVGFVVDDEDLLLLGEHHGGSVAGSLAGLTSSGVSTGRAPALFFSLPGGHASMLGP